MVKSGTVQKQGEIHLALRKEASNINSLMSTLLDTYNSQAQRISTEVNAYRRTPVRLSEVQKTGRQFSSGNALVTDTALKDLFGILSIKNGLVEEIKSDEEQWVPLQNCLADIKNDRTVTAIKKDNQIIRFFNEPTEEEKSLDLSRGLTLLGEYLEKHDDSTAKLHGLSFNPITLQIESQIRFLDKKVDVFQNQQDIWDTGFTLLYGERHTAVSAFFLRLICTNGMTAQEEVAQRYFNNQEFKANAFHRLIDKTVNAEFTGVIRKGSERLQSNRASLREFYQARTILAKENSDLAKNYFDDQEIVEAYKDHRLRYQNRRWMASANSNINAYDFFNRLTHCTSHNELSPSTRMALNNQASEMLFKGPDFAFQAPDPFTVRNN